MRIGSRILTSAAAVLSVVALTSCDTTAEPVAGAAFSDGAGARPDRTTDALLRSVAAASARFHSTVQAEKAGYAPDPFCVAHPVLGGMGHHWVNFALVDATFDPLKPEVVLYAPTGPNGKLELVAIEYLVADVGQPAPTFGNQPFDVGGAPVPFPHWTLHVWLWRDNPAGTFVPFNPTVSCPAGD